MYSSGRKMSLYASRVVEHNLGLIESADWLIDVGPEGGHRGGRLVAEGTPEQVAEHPASFTGQFLRDVLRVELAAD